MLSYEETQAKLLAGTITVTEKPNPQAVIDFLIQNINAWSAIDLLYTPSEALIARLQQFEEWCTKKDVKVKRAKAKEPLEDAGRLMEEIALLACCCLKGHEDVKSYQSYAPQIDLSITGSSPEWLLIMDYLHIDRAKRSIMVEAKNLAKKVDDKQFSRFCYHLHTKNTVQLGVFFTRFGATGFPQLGEHIRSLRDAQATQILFHARHNKYVVVLNQAEILSLGMPGALIRLLETKIRAIEEWTGFAEEDLASEEMPTLPEHLAKYFRDA